MAATANPRRGEAPVDGGVRRGGYVAALAGQLLALSLIALLAAARPLYAKCQTSDESRATPERIAGRYRVGGRIVATGEARVLGVDGIDAGT